MFRRVLALSGRRRHVKPACASTYTLQQSAHLPELQSHVTVWRHEKTRSTHVNIRRNDPNNVFCVGFRTAPANSTGIPHILEHTVLCGSKKFPCRDPFFKMLNRSLATFMNAMTGPDCTFFPFATTNERDFRNLLEVYTDACFRPLLNELDFLQEGWRLQPDGEKNIKLAGVVFNEMKGAFSSADSLFSERLLRRLYPDTAYGHSFGGDPLHIPELTWAKLKEFYRRFYHPSNASFVTYGNLPAEGHLKFLHDDVLSKSEWIQPETVIGEQPRWKQPQTDEITCPIDPMSPPERQAVVARGFITNRYVDIFETYTMTILGQLLVSGENSPFYQSLVLSGLGADYSPFTGYEASIKEPCFTVGLKGVRPEDTDRVLATIDATFEKTYREGFTEKQVEAVLHGIELSLKHQTVQFGLGVAMNLMPTLVHGADVVEALDVTKQLARFRESLAGDRNFLKEKIRVYFLENPHSLALKMVPRADFEKRRDDEEAAVLRRLVSALSSDDKKEVVRKAEALTEYQKRHVDVSCLPSLQIGDISKRIQPVSLTERRTAGVPVQVCEAATNGVSYFRAMIDVAELSDELKPLLPLFCAVLTKMGADDLDYAQLSQAIDSKTGGLSAQMHVVDSPLISEGDSFREHIVLSSHCLEKNVEPMLTLWRKILTKCKWDEPEQFGAQMRMKASELAEAIPTTGHAFAMTLAATPLSPSAMRREMYSGLAQVARMREIVEKGDVNHLVAQMQEINTFVCDRSRLRCSLNSAPSDVERALGEVANLLETLPCSTPTRGPKTPAGATASSGHLLPRFYVEFPFSVHFCAHVFRTVPYAHRDFASLRVLSKLMTAKRLHMTIREIGGAYGAGALSESSGFFQLYSYRDPNREETLKRFDDCVDWVLRGNHLAQDIDEAKLRVFQKLDYPIAPGDLGMSAFLHGISDELRQLERERVFAVTERDLLDVASRYLKENAKSSIAIFGPRPQANLSEEWTVIRQGN